MKYQNINYFFSPAQLHFYYTIQFHVMIHFFLIDTRPKDHPSASSYGGRSRSADRDTRRPERKFAKIKKKEPVH